ncbi:GyrI-like domain-containing protein [Bacillus lacus]|uniref:GyrI-like domain-containing protein n=1 Tax=Metabacillus lacus TaxID=1983721 RepID=A0A7X2J1V5_9BACI|nr:GyrI-like domain-containing protein [Metabacillus lacus]MRX73815.1 GyrI-like domain-containing protein [Metabacillus lacus]
MDFRIERIEYELRLAGRGKSVKTSRAAKDISSHWSSAKKDGFMQKLIDMSWENPQCTLESLLGVCGENAAITDEEFTYFMGVRYDGDPPSHMETLTIPPSTWAVFPKVSDAWKHLYTEWLPASGYELGNTPCIECFYPPKHKPRNELWVPVVQKQ